MNANRYYIFLFTTFLVISFVFSNFAIHTTAQTWVKYCNFPIGTSQWCKNNGTGNDALTKFNNSMRDYVKPTSAYKMNFIQTRWYPSVTRGEPIYQYYTLYDNKNGTYWRYDQHFGKFLNDYSYINTGLSKNVDYYPISVISL